MIRLNGLTSKCILHNRICILGQWILRHIVGQRITLHALLFVPHNLYHAVSIRIFSVFLKHLKKSFRCLPLRVTWSDAKYTPNLPFVTPTTERFLKIRTFWNKHKSSYLYILNISKRTECYVVNGQIPLEKPAPVRIFSGRNIVQLFFTDVKHHIFCTLP